MTGVEISGSMLETALYKFHLRNGEKIIPLADASTRGYWDSFRAESVQFARSERVGFMLSDIQTAGLPADYFSGAVANQVMHWTDLPLSFSRLNQWLKTGADLVWNSASHYYEDHGFPSLEYGFRYNDFMRCVLEIIARKANVRALETLSRPTQDIESIKAATSPQGFSTEQIGTSLLPVDLQVFMTNHVPAFVEALLETEMGPEDRSALTNEAIAEAVKNPAALSDSRHKYEIVPFFRSTKIF